MIKYFLFIAVFFCQNIFGQQINSWQNYTDMKFINDIVIKDNVVWAASNGGAYGFWKDDSSYLTLTKSEGLASNIITSIDIDEKNNIWLGTSEGYINVYDPAENKFYTILQIYKTNKSIKSINDITISGDTAYVSTAFGLVLINVNDFSILDSILKFGNFSSETPVKNIYLGATIYVVTQAGLAVKKEGIDNLTAPESWNNISIGTQIPANNITEITEYNDQIYISTDRGVIRNNNNSWDVFLYSNSEVFDLHVNDGSLYSLLSNTIHKYDGIDKIEYEYTNALFNSFHINEDNSIAIGSNKGTIYTSESNTMILSPNGPKVNSFLSMTVDADGNLWSGTGDDVTGVGVLRFDGAIWTFNDRVNTPIFKTNSFHKVSSSPNAAYFSNWGRGFARYKDNEFEQFDANNTSITGIPGSETFIVLQDIKEDNNGNAWILNFWAADKKSLSVLTNDENWFHYQFASPLIAEIVQADNLVIDQYNTKWFGVIGLGEEGLYYFNENGTLDNLSDDIWGKITRTTGLRDKDVNALAIDKFGELIIGTSIGVDVIPDPSNLNSLRGDQYFAVRQQTINSIAVDPINQKWFGTEKGIFLLSSDGSRLIANFDKSNSPLPSDNILSLAIDENNGIVYVGTDFGVTAISTLFIKPNNDFSDLYAYPNPIAISSSLNSIVNIDGLVENSEIKILDISGKLINQFRSIGGKTTPWNCKDFNGQLVASGIYIVVAFDEEASEVGHTKIAVLRK